MKIVLFSVSYSMLLFGVALGLRETPYPLGMLWRWRHDRYRNL